MTQEAGGVATIGIGGPRRAPTPPLLTYMHRQVHAGALSLALLAVVAGVFYARDHMYADEHLGSFPGRSAQRTPAAPEASADSLAGVDAPEASRDHSESPTSEASRPVDSDASLLCYSTIGLPLLRLEYKLSTSENSWTACPDGARRVPVEAALVRANGHQVAEVVPSSTDVALAPSAYVQLKFPEGSEGKVQLLRPHDYQAGTLVEQVTGARYVAAIDVDYWRTEGLASFQRELLVDGTVLVALDWRPAEVRHLERELAFSVPNAAAHTTSARAVPAVGVESLPRTGWQWSVIHHNAYSPQRGARKPWQGAGETVGDWGSISVSLAVNIPRRVESSGSEARLTGLPAEDLVTVEAWDPKLRLCGATTFNASEPGQVLVPVFDLHPITIAVLDASTGAALSGSAVYAEVEHDVDAAGDDAFLAGAWNHTTELLLDGDGRAQLELLARPRPRSRGLASPSATARVTLSVPGYHEHSARTPLAGSGTQGPMVFSLERRPSTLVARDASGLAAMPAAPLYPVLGDSVVNDDGFAALRPGDGSIHFTPFDSARAELPRVEETLLFSDLMFFGIGVERLGPEALRAVPSCERVITFVNFTQSEADMVNVEWGWHGHYSNWGSVSPATMRYDGGRRETLTAPASNFHLRLRYSRDDAVVDTVVLELPDSDCDVDLKAREVRSSPK